MPREPLFQGLVVDEFGQPVATAYVGSEPCYVFDDAGFKRHIPSEDVDRQVLHKLREQIQGHEELISEEALKMMGQDDIFSRAMFIEQLKNIDQQFDEIIATGIPEEGRAYMGLAGFQIVINRQGDVLQVNQPGMGSTDSWD